MGKILCEKGTFLQIWSQLMSILHNANILHSYLCMAIKHLQFTLQK